MSSKKPRRRRRLSTWVDMHGGESLFGQSDEMTSLIQARTALRDHIFRVAANPESERNGRTWKRFISASVWTRCPFGNRYDCDSSLMHHQLVSP